MPRAASPPPASPHGLGVKAGGPVAKSVGKAAQTASKPATPVGTALSTPVSKPVSKTAAKTVSRSGGARPGAGRPLGSGKLGRDTTSMRLPRSLLETLTQARDTLVSGADLPGAPVLLDVFGHEVRAGLPFLSQDADGSPQRVDLYTLFSPKPESTFLLKVSGWSMPSAGIHDGDYLVVDRSIPPRNGHVVVAHLDGEGLVAKRLRIDKSGSFLDSESDEFTPIALVQNPRVKIWGVARAKASLLI